MKFKIGDKVRIKKNRKRGSRCYDFLHSNVLHNNKVYTIKDFCSCGLSCKGNREVFLNIGGFYCEESDLELAYKKEKMTEVEWLDAIQQNERHGY